MLWIETHTPHITGLVSKTAIWKFNVITRANNWTAIMKNPKGNEMNWNSTKYEMSVKKIYPLQFDLRLKVHFINWEDMGYYNLHMKSDRTVSQFGFLHLTVKGKLEKWQ